MSIEATELESGAMVEGRPLVEARSLNVTFPIDSGMLFSRRRSYVRAVRDVNLHIAKGETLGLVGESGSGKTTLGRAILLQTPVASGTIKYAGNDITNVRGEALRRARRHMQLIFQDPYGSLNPRMRVFDIVAEPLIVHGVEHRKKDVRAKVVSLLDTVGMPADSIYRYPHAFSGGQRQRIGIARALALAPDFLVADEPVSALDVSVRAQVVNLFQDLQRQFKLTYLFIAHDLAIVRHISHRIAIMYAGRIVEIGTQAEIYDAPRHPYTRALLSAVLEPDPETRHREKQVAASEPPNVVDPPDQCPFVARCPYATDQCRVSMPPLTRREGNHLVACFEQ